MDYTPYLVFLSSRTQYQSETQHHSMEPPKSPKFNITLWQPWLAEKQEAPTSGSDCAPGPGPGAPEGVGAPKQLPSSKWRRDRRSTTRIPDYKHREPGLTGSTASRSQSFNDKSSSLPLGALRLRQEGLHHSEGDLAQDSADGGPTRGTVSFASLKGSSTPPKAEYLAECPLDMSVKVPVGVRPALPPPPPSYSQAISSGLLYRPSVITQAPTNGAPPAPAPLSPTTKDAGKGEYVPGSMSMCDPVIDEHFRRSLGPDYMTLFSKAKESNSVSNGKSPKAVTKDRGSSPIMFPSDPCTKFLNSNSKPLKHEDSPQSDMAEEDEDDEEEEEESMDVDDTAGLSVDDHFAKALGDTWKKLQAKKPKVDILKSKSPEITKSKTPAVNNRKDLPNSNHDSKIIRGIFI